MTRAFLAALLVLIYLPALADTIPTPAPEPSLLEQRADAGSGEAQWQLGAQFAEAQNFAEAEKWWRRASRQGEKKAWAGLCRLFVEKKIPNDRLETYFSCKIASLGAYNSEIYSLLTIAGERLSGPERGQQDFFAENWRPSLDEAAIRKDAEFKKGMTAYEQQDFQSAFKIWLPLAQANKALDSFQPDYYFMPDIRAAGALAKLYFDGKGVERNYEQAIMWAKEANRLGDQDGTNILKEVDNVLRDDSLSDVEKARQYPQKKEQHQDLERSASEGDVKAELALGKLYTPNRWGQSDYAKAAALFNSAGDQGYEDAQKELCAFMTQNRIWGELNATPDVIKNYEGKAADWCEKFAQAGDASAQKNLGLIYAWGWGRPQNRDVALQWYLKGAEQNTQVLELKGAAEAGDSDAQFALGTWYGCIPDALAAKEELEWVGKAAAQGNWRAQIRLARAFETGIADRHNHIQIPANHNEAYFWYSVALRSGKLPTPTQGAATTFSSAFNPTTKNVEDLLQTRLVKKMTRQQVDALNERIADWKPNKRFWQIFDAEPKLPPNWICK